MNKSVGTSYIKNKFSTLLSKFVVEAKLSLDEITNRLIENDFLDCFETNDLTPFYDKSYEAITYDLFKKELIYSEDTDPVIYWCGLQYMNIFLNRRIPLKQLLLLCPLSEMVKYFEIYHEQSEIKFIDVFFKEKYNNSILKTLRNKRNYSLRELSILTGVNVNTLKYYEINDNLYKASFVNINRILYILKYSESLVKEKTSYIPSFVSLLNDKELRKLIEEYIYSFYNTKDKIEYELNDFWLIGKRNKLISQDILDSAIIYSIEEYNNKHKNSKLIF